MQKPLKRANVEHVKNLVLYLKNYQELSPGIIHKSLSSGSVAH